MRSSHLISSYFTTLPLDLQVLRLRQGLCLRLARRREAVALNQPLLYDFLLNFRRASTSLEPLTKCWIQNTFSFGLQKKHSAARFPYGSRTMLCDVVIAGSANSARKSSSPNFSWCRPCNEHGRSGCGASPRQRRRNLRGRCSRPAVRPRPAGDTPRGPVRSVGGSGLVSHQPAEEGIDRVDRPVMPLSMTKAIGMEITSIRLGASWPRLAVPWGCNTEFDPRVSRRTA